ncbi:MAG: mannose-1-phosphate guanylyltransferase/mannose-6-phosphate isomerase [Nitrospirae bacterium]|nr:mannose-1-phosphate guanylyltransferase/mannose-6-phosphate isomerase [Nitrospirota bacterium]
MNNAYIVIMAGGSGTRFWPLSREAMPKQLLRIDGGESLIQQTISRVRPFIQSDHIHIVTNKSQSEQIKYQVAELGKENFIIEPAAKNTAAAVGLAAVYLNHQNADSVMGILPADHVVKNKEQFLATMRFAFNAAAEGCLVTIGIRPGRPETGYGYIHAGDQMSRPDAASSNDTAGIFHVDRFTEKPDIDTAKKYVAEGNYFWNSGMFVWKTSVILDEIERYMPSLGEGLKKIKSAIGQSDESTVIGKVFSGLESVSIDYGIMEKSDKVVVIPADLGWSDVGSWTALDDISAKDARGNVISGNVVDLESRDSIIYASNRLVATAGLTDMVVVDTEDATLVCHKDKAQDVKKIVDELKRRGAEEHLTHRTVIRPWGSYTLLEKSDRFKIKRIVVNPGARLSFQMHYHRSEHWVVVSGTAKVRRGEEEFFVNPNESTYIPMETKHRLENPGRIPLQIIEVQNGEYLEEDDIVRFDDAYGRE